jgi:hypothetical protein
MCVVCSLVVIQISTIYQSYSSCTISNFAMYLTLEDLEV